MTSAPSTTRDPIAAAYRERLGQRSKESARRRLRVTMVSYARLAVFFLVVAAVWLAWETDRLPWPAVLVPVGAFVGLVLWHGRLGEALSRSELAERFYRRGIDRLEERWPGTGRGGEAFVDDEHPYARDLDLFGEGSLFERLATTVSPWGAKTLADWLRAGATAEEIAARQEAVRELAPRLDLRETVATENGELEEGVSPEALAEWAAGAVELRSTAVRVSALVLGVANVCLGLSWLLSWTAREPFFLVLLLSGLLAAAHRERVRRVMARVQAPARDLVVLSSLLARFEKEGPRFSAERLVHLVRELSVEGESASSRIRRLTLLIDLLDARRNQLFVPFAALLLWATQFAFALESFRGRVGPQVPRWLAAVGELDALLALSAYAYEQPDDPFPDIVTERLEFEADGLGHPLLARARLVRNDVRFGDELRLLVVSGSNMSGKSTLLRAIGVNCVLALAGAPVRARRLALSPFIPAASICIQDSLQRGISHFYAEILRLRQIMELASGERPVLFLLDEILHGTNSHDRRIGAEAVVRGLLARGAVGLITTHDLALSEMADAMGAEAANVHFEDHIEDGKVRFDYVLRGGVVKKSNALELMRSIGLEV